MWWGQTSGKSRRPSYSVRHYRVLSRVANMSDVSDGYDRLLSMLTGDGELDTRRRNVWLFHCAVVTIPVRSDGASTNRKSAHHGVMLLPLPACFLDEFLYRARYDSDIVYRLVSPSEISDRPCDPWRGHGVVSRRRYLFNTRCFARRAETRKCGCRRIGGRRYLSLPL